MRKPNSLANESTAARLRRRWIRLLPVGADPAVALAVHDGLVSAYAQHGRHYHTLAHIDQLLAMADAEARHFVDFRTVELAIHFHDAVYEIGRTDNETASADFAARSLQALGIPDAIRRKVRAMIEATAHIDETAAVTDPDLARFLDLDLSILATDPADYDSYAAAIRLEYAVYPDTAYRAGRAKVLTAFLERARLFRCDDHHVAWDTRARANIQRELTGLAR